MGLVHAHVDVIIRILCFSGVVRQSHVFFVFPKTQGKTFRNNMVVRKNLITLKLYVVGRKHSSTFLPSKRVGSDVLFFFKVRS